MTEEIQGASAPISPVTPAVVSQILAACGITKVIWIDDDFHLGSLTTVDIIERIRRNYIADGSLPQPLQDMRAKAADDEELFTSLTRRLEDDGDLAKTLSKSLVDTGGEPGDGELTPEIRRKLSEDLGAGCTFHSYSHGAWLEAHDSHLRENVGVLYLVDNNYFKESLGSDLGRDIIHNQLLSASASHRAHCVLFTKSAASGGEAIPEVTSGGRTYLVLAKKNFTEGLQNSQLFANAIRRIVNHLYVLEIAEKTQSEFLNKLQIGLTELKALSVHALEELFFARPEHEGASELETVNRLWSMIGQRDSVDVDILGRANVIRKIRRLHTGSEFDGPAAIDPFVKRLGETQFFIPGALINGQHCQLASGDIFENEKASGDQEKHAILVWQPCDIALRVDGERISKCAWYIPFKQVQHNSETFTDRLEKMRSGKVFYLEMGKYSLGLIEFRLDKAKIANLTIFDIAGVNSDGRLYMKDENSPELPALPGEIIRYNKVIAKCRKSMNGSNASAFCDAERTGVINRASSPKEIDYQLRRVKRLRDAYSQEVLRSMCGMIARPGFEYALADLRENPVTTNVLEVPFEGPKNESGRI